MERAINFDLNVGVKWISAFSDTIVYCEEMYILDLARPVQFGNSQSTEPPAHDQICVLSSFLHFGCKVYAYE